MSNGRKGIGGHQSANMRSEDWITPPEIVDSLGVFDLDPCSSINQPWPMAENNYTKHDDGLGQPWTGRVWLNPPYGLVAKEWLEKLANHGNGIALIFARTETRMFFDTVWDRADALLFIKGRLYFYYPDGNRATANAGAPSVLVAYGKNNTEALENSFIDGKIIHIDQEPL